MSSRNSRPTPEPADQPGSGPATTSKAGSWARHKSAWATFFLPVLIVILATAGGAELFRDALQYQREQLVPWRLLGAHLVHLSWSHTLLNAAGLLLIGIIFSFRVQTWLWWVCFALAVACIDVGLTLFSPNIRWYVGLSGVLHGLFVLGAFSEWRQGQRTGIYLLGAVAAKLAFEQWAGALPMTAGAAGGPVVVDAHLYGALGGVVACGLMRAFQAGPPGPERGVRGESD